MSLENHSRKFLITKFACAVCGNNLSLSYRNEEHKPKGSYEKGEPTGANMVQQIVIVEPCKCVTDRLDQMKRAARILFGDDKSVMSRKVIVYEMKHLTGSRLERTKAATGIFRRWGLRMEEDERGFTNESMAIVELDDGNIITPRADLIQFVKDEARLSVGDKVILYDRYNFAIPVKGVINRLIPENNSAVINLATTNNPHYPVGSEFFALTKQLEIDES